MKSKRNRNRAGSQQGVQTRHPFRLAAIVALCLAAPQAWAQWVDGTVTEVRALADPSVSPIGTPMIAVYATLTPNPGCATPAFMLMPSDQLYKETYAMLLAAKLSGSRIRYLHVYCHSSGYSRGNGYSLAP